MVQGRTWGRPRSGPDRSPLRGLVLGAALLGHAGGCALFGGSAPPPEPCKTIPLEVYAKGSADQNPNAEGQALPVELRIFVLSQREAFDQLDVSELVGDELPEDLAKVVVQKASLRVMPGQEQILPLEIAPSAGYLGLVGNFRRVEPGQGKRLVELKRAIERCRAGQLSTQIPATLKESRLLAPERVE